MKFTPKQTELINEYKRLEKEYGEGNVFLRYINDFWKIRFIIHRSGQAEYKPIYDYRINGKIINGLQKIKCLSDMIRNIKKQILIIIPTIKKVYIF